MMETMEMSSEIKVGFILVWSAETDMMFGSQTEGTILDERAWTTKLINHLVGDERVRDVLIGTREG